MREFISILISFIFMSLAESVDAFFNNKISIDAIIVCSSLFSINLLARSLGEIGTYTYRVIRKREFSYLTITGIISLIVGLIIFLLRPLLINLFDISINQKILLSNVLALYIIYLPVSLVDGGFFEIVRLKNNLKLYRKSLILFYTLLILFDLLAFYFTKSLVMLYIATIIAHLINTVYLTINFKLKRCKISVEDISNIRKYGISLTTERLLSRIFILGYGVLASYMGELKYAVHSICYSVCLNLEIITSAYSAALMIKIPEVQDKKKQIILLKEYMKKCFAIVLIINFVVSLIMLIIQHGSLPIKNCFPYIILYSCTVFGLYLYESYKAICVIQKKPVILLKGSIIGVISRVAVCLLFLKSSVNLYIFGVASLLDFYIRGMYYKYRFNKETNLDDFENNIDMNSICITE